MMVQCKRREYHFVQAHLARVHETWCAKSDFAWEFDVYYADDIISREVMGLEVLGSLPLIPGLIEMCGNSKDDENAWKGTNDTRNMTWHDKRRIVLPVEALEEEKTVRELHAFTMKEFMCICRDEENNMITDPFGPYPATMRYAIPETEIAQVVYLSDEEPSGTSSRSSMPPPNTSVQPQTNAVFRNGEESDQTSSMVDLNSGNEGSDQQSDPAPPSHDDSPVLSHEEEDHQVTPATEDVSVKPIDETHEQQHYQQSSNADTQQAPQSQPPSPVQPVQPDPGQEQQHVSSTPTQHSNEEKPDNQQIHEHWLKAGRYTLGEWTYHYDRATWKEPARSTEIPLPRGVTRDRFNWLNTWTVFEKDKPTNVIERRVIRMDQYAGLHALMIHANIELKFPPRAQLRWYNKTGTGETEFVSMTDEAKNANELATYMTPATYQSLKKQGEWASKFGKSHGHRGDQFKDAKLWKNKCEESFECHAKSSVAPKWIMMCDPEKDANAPAPTITPLDVMTWWLVIDPYVERIQLRNPGRKCVRGFDANAIRDSESWMRDITATLNSKVLVGSQVEAVKARTTIRIMLAKLTATDMAALAVFITTKLGEDAHTLLQHFITDEWETYQPQATEISDNTTDSDQMEAECAIARFQRAVGTTSRWKGHKYVG